MTSFTRALMIASAVIALSACSKKAPEELPPPPVDTARPAEATPPAGMDPAPAEMTGFSFGTNPYLR